MLRQLDRNLWVLDKPFQKMGIDLGGRMTVIKLPSGGLWIHSPVRTTPEDRAALDRLGPVQHIVAPNDAHHLFVGEFRSCYPEARLHVAPGLPRKDPRLDGDELTAEKTKAAWEGAIEQQFIAGFPRLNETVFLYGRTLIVTDLVFNITHVDGLLTQLFMALDGALTGVRATRIVRALLKDQDKARASLERVLTWDFERLIVTHGEVYSPGARDALRNAYRSLLED